jgi:hypothetical protein
MSTFIPTPQQLAKQTSLINIRNNDKKCFAYSVLAALYPAKKRKKHVSCYKRHLPKLNMTGSCY